MVNARPYPVIDVWELDSSAIGATIAAVQRPGRDGKEGGVFWIGTRGQTSVVHAVVIPAGEGVIEDASFWRVTPEVFGAAVKVMGIATGESTEVEVSFMRRRAREPGRQSAGGSGACADPRLRQDRAHE